MVGRSCMRIVFAAVATPVFAQGGTQTATLSGVVTDKDGGVIPAPRCGHEPGDRRKTQQCHNANGGYSFPGLVAGAYKVTISLTGFKTAEIDVRVQTGSTNSIDKARGRHHFRSRHGHGWHGPGPHADANGHVDDQLGLRSNAAAVTARR